MWRGAIDSFRGAYVLFHVDHEINQKIRSRLSPTKLPSKSSQKQKSSSSSSDLDESRVLLRVCQCCALNGGVFLSSIIAFYWMLLPFVQMVLGWAHADSAWLWTRAMLSLVFEVAWVMPLFALSKIVNGLWFQVNSKNCIYSFVKRQL